MPEPSGARCDEREFRGGILWGGVRFLCVSVFLAPLTL